MSRTKMVVICSVLIGLFLVFGFLPMGMDIIESKEWSYASPDEAFGANEAPDFVPRFASDIHVITEADNSRRWLAFRADRFRIVLDTTTYRRVFPDSTNTTLSGPPGVLWFLPGQFEMRRRYRENQCGIKAYIPWWTSWWPNEINATASPVALREHFEFFVRCEPFISKGFAWNTTRPISYILLVVSESEPWVYVFVVFAAAA